MSTAASLKPLLIKQAEDSSVRSYDDDDNSDVEVVDAEEYWSQINSFFGYNGELNFSLDGMDVGQIAMESSVSMLATSITRLIEENTYWDSGVVRRAALMALATLTSDDISGLDETTTWKEVWEEIILQQLLSAQSETILIGISAGDNGNMEGPSQNIRCTIHTTGISSTATWSHQQLQEFVRNRISLLSKCDVEHTPITKYMHHLRLTTPPAQCQKQMEDVLEEIWRNHGSLMAAGRNMIKSGDLAACEAPNSTAGERNDNCKGGGVPGRALHTPSPSIAPDLIGPQNSLGEPRVGPSARTLEDPAKIDSADIGFGAVLPRWNEISV